MSTLAPESATNPAISVRRSVVDWDEVEPAPGLRARWALKELDAVGQDDAKASAPFESGGAQTAGRVGCGGVQATGGPHLTVGSHEDPRRSGPEPPGPRSRRGVVAPLCGRAMCAHATCACAWCRPRVPGPVWSRSVCSTRCVSAPSVFATPRVSTPRTQALMPAPSYLRPPYSRLAAPSSDAVSNAGRRRGSKAAGEVGRRRPGHCVSLSHPTTIWPTGVRADGFDLDF